MLQIVAKVPPGGGEPGTGPGRRFGRGYARPWKVGDCARLRRFGGGRALPWIVRGCAKL